jgi:YD repeat-containing protein
MLNSPVTKQPNPLIFVMESEREPSIIYKDDRLDRLISATGTGGTDDFGAVVLNKSFNDTAPFHAPKAVNMGGVQFNLGHDDNGNMTNGWDFSDPAQVASRTISYNADNMPESIVHEYNGTTSLDYDGEGTRVKKAVSGGATTYYIGGHFEVVNGVETKYIFAGNLRIAKVTSSAKSFFHKDHLGSSTVT